MLPVAKNPKAKQQPDTSKTPRKVGFDENPNHLRPAWRVGHLEMCDPFGWHEINAELLAEIRQKLRDFESMKWSEILGRNNHLVDRSDLCKEARDRLEALGLDDLDQLLSLRLTGAGRVWGMLEHNVVTLLWWDPEHKVCPSYKKGT